MTLQKSAAVVVPAACRRRSHAGKPRAARVLYRYRVDYRMAPTTVGHGCTMDADSATRITQHEVDAEPSLRAASGSLRSACSHVGWRPAPRLRLLARGPSFVLHRDSLRFRPVSDATTVAARLDSIAPTPR